MQRFQIASLRDEDLREGKIRHRNIQGTSYRGTTSPMLVYRLVACAEVLTLLQIMALAEVPPALARSPDRR